MGVVVEGACPSIALTGRLGHGHRATGLLSEIPEAAGHGLGPPTPRGALFGPCLPTAYIEDGLWAYHAPVFLFFGCVE